MLMANARSHGGVPSYAEVVEKLKGRTVKQVRERWENSLNPTIEHGSWPVEVQIKLLQCVANQSFFTGTTMSWKRLQLEFPNRSCNSIKKKARTLLGEKVSKKSERVALEQAKEWTMEEQTKLLQLHQEHGDDYEAICVGLRTGRARAQIDRRLLEVCSCSNCLTRLQAVSAHGPNLKVAWTIYKAKSVEASLRRASMGASQDETPDPNLTPDMKTDAEGASQKQPAVPNPPNSSFPGKVLRNLQSAVGKLIPESIAAYSPTNYIPLMPPQLFAHKGQAYVEQQQQAQEQLYQHPPPKVGVTSPTLPNLPQSNEHIGQKVPAPTSPLTGMPGSLPPPSSSSSSSSVNDLPETPASGSKRKRSDTLEEEMKAQEVEAALKRSASGGPSLGFELYQSINQYMGFQTLRNICRNGVRNGFEMVTPSLVLMFRASTVSELVGRDPRFADDFLFPKPEDQNFSPDKPVGTLIRSMTTYQVTYSCPYHKELFGYDVLDKFFFATCYSRFLAYYMSVKGLPVYYRTGELWMRSLEYKADGSVVITKVKYNPLPGGFNICKYQDVTDKYKHLLDLPPLFA